MTTSPNPTSQRWKIAGTFILLQSTSPRAGGGKRLLTPQEYGGGGEGVRKHLQALQPRESSLQGGGAQRPGSRTVCQAQVGAQRSSPSPAQHPPPAPGSTAIPELQICKFQPYSDGTVSQSMALPYFCQPQPPGTLSMPSPDPTLHRDSPCLAHVCWLGRDGILQEGKHHGFP